MSRKGFLHYYGFLFMDLSTYFEITTLLLMVVGIVVGGTAYTIVFLVALSSLLAALIDLWQSRDKRGKMIKRCLEGEESGGGPGPSERGGRSGERSGRPLAHAKYFETDASSFEHATLETRKMSRAVDLATMVLALTSAVALWSMGDPDGDQSESEKWGQNLFAATILTILIVLEGTCDAVEFFGPIVGLIVPHFFQRQSGRRKALFCIVVFTVFAAWWFVFGPGFCAFAGDGEGESNDEHDAETEWAKDKCHGSEARQITVFIFLPVFAFVAFRMTLMVTHSRRMYLAPYGFNQYLPEVLFKISGTSDSVEKQIEDQIKSKGLKKLCEEYGVQFEQEQEVSLIVLAFKKTTSSWLASKYPCCLVCCCNWCSISKSEEGWHSNVAVHGNDGNNRRWRGAYRVKINPENEKVLSVAPGKLYDFGAAEPKSCCCCCSLPKGCDKVQSESKDTKDVQRALGAQPPEHNTPWGVTFCRVYDWKDPEELKFQQERANGPGLEELEDQLERANEPQDDREVNLSGNHRVCPAPSATSCISEAAKSTMGTKEVVIGKFEPFESTSETTGWVKYTRGEKRIRCFECLI